MDQLWTTSNQLLLLFALQGGERFTLQGGEGSNHSGSGAAGVRRSTCQGQDASESAKSVEVGNFFLLQY